MKPHSPLSSPTEARLLRRLQWRMALGFAVAFLIFDVVVVGLTYTVLQYHFIGEAKTAITGALQRPLPQQPAAGNREIPAGFHDHDADDAATRTEPPGDELPRVIIWQFNRQGRFVNGMPSLYGLPAPVSAILPDQSLLRQMPHTHQILWHVVRYQNFSVMVGSQPAWHDGHFQGTAQAVYSMGQLAAVMRGLLAVDAEISVIVVALLILLAFWLSGRSLGPIRHALARQRDFVQDVSHELRTPLTIVKSSLELALTDPDRASVDEAVKNSLQEVDYITRLMGDLATLARIESGATLIQPAQMDVFDLADEVVAALQPLAEERHVSVSLEHRGVDSRIEADPVQIRQLLIILLDNALKYNRPDGRATVTVQVDPRRVHLAVEDTGHGIPPEDLPHLFDRFYRSRSVTRLAPGSGLGLAIADWIVKAHRGTIHVESHVGEGTRLTVEWPREIPET